MAVAEEVLGEAAEHHARPPRTAAPPERKQEQHRHEHQLGRDREAVADREATRAKSAYVASSASASGTSKARSDGHGGCKRDRVREEGRAAVASTGELAAAQGLGGRPVQDSLTYSTAGADRSGGLEDPHGFWVYRQLRAWPMDVRSMDGRSPPGLWLAGHVASCEQRGRDGGPFPTRSDDWLGCCGGDWLPGRTHQAQRPSDDVRIAPEMDLPGYARPGRNPSTRVRQLHELVRPTVALVTFRGSRASLRGRRTIQELS